MPTTPIELIAQAVDTLATGVTINEPNTTTTHAVFLADGLETPAVTTALGRYLTGAIAGAVGLNANLSDTLMMTGVNRREELEKNITRLIGAHNTFTTDKEVKFRDTQRNAWLGEGITHALLFVRAHHNTLILDGSVRALQSLHVIPSEPGLDAVAIYEGASTPVVAVGESKATKNDGSGQLTKAAKIFADIDGIARGPELRTALTALVPVLPPEIAANVSEAIWRDNRCYLPVILHERAFDLTTDRPTLGGLAPIKDRKRLIALRVSNFDTFLDNVADAMRAAVPEVLI